VQAKGKYFVKVSSTGALFTSYERRRRYNS
jgi:hypothetical protein